MQTFLILQDLWNLVYEGYVEPDVVAFVGLTIGERKELLETRKKYVKDLFVIQIMIYVTIFPKIAKCKFSKVAWDTLVSSYKGSSRVIVAKLQLLHWEFKSL